MKIAVVGAGIFGVTIALNICKIHNVTLYDINNDIMTSASRANQLRLHRGYHYPRSPKTAKELLHSINYFIDEYKDSIVYNHDHYYSIAKEKSLVSPSQYLEFCDMFNLEYKVIDNFKHVNNEKIAMTVTVKESLLDYDSVYNTCKERLKKSNIKNMLGTKFTKKDMSEFDIVINCTYANINYLLSSEDRLKYKFEVCEKIAVEMPKDMKNKSIVVMDGPFMCVDPYGRTGLSLLGNVVHAIHHTNTGHFPTIPVVMFKDLDNGLVLKPKISNYSKFIETGKSYIPSLVKAKYKGSMYTVRAVLPNMEKTDGRPTIVSNTGNKIINVFSGKIDTCVRASKLIIDNLSEVK
jgi:hypothetical protein